MVLRGISTDDDGGGDPLDAAYARLSAAAIGLRKLSYSSIFRAMKVSPGAGRRITSAIEGAMSPD